MPAKCLNTAVNCVATVTEDVIMNSSDTAPDDIDPHEEAATDLLAEIRKYVSTGSSLLLILSYKTV